MRIAIFGYDNDHQPTMKIISDEEHIGYHQRRLIHNFENSAPVPGIMRIYDHEAPAEFDQRVADRLTWFRSLVGRPQISGNPYKQFITVTPLGGGEKRETLRCWDRLCMDKPNPERFFADYYKKGDEWYVQAHNYHLSILNEKLIAQLEALLAAEKEALTI